MAKIEVKNVSVVFEDKKQPVTAVRDVSFSVAIGEIFGIVGLSGAGKSTLIRTLNLLEKPTSGEILIDGAAIQHLQGGALRKTRQKIGMIFQQFNLIDNRTVAENIAFALKAGDYPKEQQAQRIDELLQLVDLTDKKMVYPRQLSGGQKQRIGIARALANNPEILLCDEATSALDVETTEEILQILERINQELGITIVFITHELEVAKRLFTRMIVMEAGEIVESGQTYQLFANPQASITKKLVGRFFNLDLPPELKEQLQRQGEVLALRYQGKAALEPLISDVSATHAVKISIIHGKIEYIQDDVIGLLFVHLTGSEEEIAKAITVLESHVAEVHKLDLEAE